MKTRKSLFTYILLIIGIIILVNVMSDMFFIRLDFTEDKRYTLSEATKNILKNLQQPVTVKVYFSEDLPPDIANTRRDFQDLLIEYANRAKGNILYEFINPNENEETEREAMKDGIQPVLINVREKDQLKQQKAYLGAVVQIGNKKEVIPIIQPGAAMEYSLSSSIKKLSIENKPKVALIQGHGEPSTDKLIQVMEQLSVLYDVIPINLNDTLGKLDECISAIILAPKDSFPESHLNKLDNFLAKGNKLFIGLNRVDGNFQNASGSTVNSNLVSWLENKGISIESSFIVDQKCSPISVIQQQGSYRIQTQIPFPYLPIISNFEKHPITEGLEAVALQFASPISYNGDTSLSFTPILLTSDKTGTQPAPIYFNIQKAWTMQDFPLQKLTVGAILTGKISGNKYSEMVIISDGDFCVNSNKNQRINNDNVSLLVNSVDWLSDDTGLIDLRTKGVTSRPLDDLEDGKKAFIKYFNFLLPIIIVIIYGLIRMQINRKKRNKRMEVGYVK
ncbi:MAG: Gldg family protein [Marinilabiliales bacterium]